MFVREIPILPDAKEFVKRTSLSLEGEARERFLGVTDENSYYSLVIDSEGLDLDKKILWEKKLREEAWANTEKRSLLYFKRAKKQLSPAGTPAPVFTKKKRKIPGVGRVFMVASGKGGVGKSTVAVNLAIALARAGVRVGLLDADIYGPSLPTLMGASGPLSTSSDGKLAPLDIHGISCVSSGLLVAPTEALMWRGPLATKALEQFCFGTDWPDLDILVVDMPPGTGDITLSMCEDIEAHGVIVVSTPEKLAWADAKRALSLFASKNLPVLGIVENMAYHICKACGHEDRTFGRGPDMHYLARIPLSSEFRHYTESGRPIALVPGAPGYDEWVKLAEIIICRCRETQQGWS